MVLAHREDRLQTVLRHRFERQLEAALREFTGLPARPLSPREHTWIRTQSAIFVALAESFHGQAPPSAGELRRADAEHDLRAAQHRVRYDALRLGHQLGVFRPVPDLAGHVEAFCAQCGAGMRIHTMTAQPSIAERLLQPCRPGPHRMPEPPLDPRD
jgi:hypothetical protein